MLQLLRHLVECFLSVIISDALAGHAPLQRFIFYPAQWEILALPLPSKPAFAFILFRVETARRTGLRLHDGDWLQTVGQNNIGVHGSHVHVVDERAGLVNWGCLLQSF